MDRRALLEKLTRDAADDKRIVGLIDYGSGGQGRADEWSDVDVAVFVREEDFAPFFEGWKAWAAGFGGLLLAYVGEYGHPWAVFAAEPRPLRVDFDLHPASHIERVLDWPMTPVRVEEMVLYDGAGGRIEECVRRILGRPDRPADLAAEFEKQTGDFWYFLLFCHDKLRRGSEGTARFVFNSQVMKHLVLLLRLEAGANDRWVAAPPAVDIENTLSAARLGQLQGCVPGPGAADLWRSLAAAAGLGREVCRSLGEAQGWPWPSTLGDRVVEVLGAAAG